MVNRLLKWLRSSELALVTMGSLAALVAAGSLIPQRLRVDPADYALWKSHLSWLMRPAEALGLTDVYRSSLFLAVVSAFALNLGLCTWTQVDRARGRMAAPARSAHERFGREFSSESDAAEARTDDGGRSAFVPSAEGHLHSGGRVVALLQAEGYRIWSVGAGAWEGRRRRYGYVFLPLFHVALVIVLAGALSVALLTFRGYVELAEGQAFESVPAQYLRTSGGLLSAKPGGEFTMRLDRLRVAFHSNGQIAVRESSVSVLSDGSDEQHVLASSHPVSVAGYRLYQNTNFGWAPLLRLARPNGAESEGFANLGEWDDTAGRVGKRSYRQVLTLPATSLTAELRAVENDPGAGEPTSPGDSGLIATDAANVALSAVIKDGSVKIYEGDLAPGQSVELPGGSTLTYVDLRRWSGFSVARTPGLWVVYVGGSAALLTLLLHFLVVPERVRVVASSSKDGSPGYRLTGTRALYAGTYPERLTVLAAGLTAGLASEAEAESGDTESEDT
ncbi:MAG: cytochrome c biogenesis protein ResB [Thermoleophilia bacterium]